MRRLFGRSERRRDADGQNHGRRKEDDPIREQAASDLEEARRRLRMLEAQIRVLRRK